MENEHVPPPPIPVERHTPTGFERWSELLVAAGFIILGIVILVESQDIRVTRSTVVSPRLVPQIVGIGILLVGAWYVFDIVRKPHDISGGEDSEDVDINAPTDWRTLILIGVGLTIFAFIVEPLGFTLASAVMFTITSTAMGSRRYLLNALIGLILGVSVFLVFDTWLGVRLPTGILENVLP
jgi:putative tricarboxylic transport membrane protein